MNLFLKSAILVLMTKTLENSQNEVTRNIMTENKGDSNLPWIGQL